MDCWIDNLDKTSTGHITTTSRDGSDDDDKRSRRNCQVLNTRLYGHAEETKRPVVTLQPNWPRIYVGETIAIRCEIKNGGGTDWEYEWRTTSSIKPPNENPYNMSAQVFHNGQYSCIGRNKSKQSSTKWSDNFKLTVHDDSPQPVLTVSPLWLSPGATVTLNCEVERASAGWRFYWYKGVRKQSENVYTYKQLPVSINGTKEDSYIVDGQTRTTRYYCRAGRGDPVYYTKYSGRKFVWSGEFNPAASLTVTPDRVQHFFSQSISLSCEGNATKWKVMRYTETGQLSHCSGWGRMTGSTCSIHSIQYGDGVYWCESGSGEYSNAVNITGLFGVCIHVNAPWHTPPIQTPLLINLIPSWQQHSTMERLV
ncbi:uncharacterized protein LOC125884320 [Epinephelus fuscoguttatus]|uniref:uncharacterized protein LOC125884320 n=1 Tax=Epinephelus fuscoguttatus TaxID=293821 RepID=UPI0020D119B0|nr:uncharacterized protein LOC125884320 [Epinephelus fuscoguttatus]